MRGACRRSCAYPAPRSRGPATAEALCQSARGRRGADLNELTTTELAGFNNATRLIARFGFRSSFARDNERRGRRDAVASAIAHEVPTALGRSKVAACGWTCVLQGSTLCRGRRLCAVSVFRSWRTGLIRRVPDGISARRARPSCVGNLTWSITRATGRSCRCNGLPPLTASRHRADDKTAWRFVSHPCLPCVPRDLTHAAQLSTRSRSLGRPAADDELWSSAPRHLLLKTVKTTPMADRRTVADAGAIAAGSRLVFTCATILPGEASEFFRSRAGSFRSRASAGCHVRSW